MTKEQAEKVIAELQAVAGRIENPDDEVAHYVRQIVLFKHTVFPEQTEHPYHWMTTCNHCYSSGATWPLGHWLDAPYDVSQLHTTGPLPSPEEALRTAARDLAVLALTQAHKEYRSNADFRDAVDDVLALTDPRNAKGS